MTQPAQRRALPAACLAAALLVVAGCSRPAVRFVPDGGAMTTATVEAAARQADVRAVSGIAVADARRTRTQALASLRSSGTDAGQAADVITRVFPADARAVPVLVEGARLNGEDVWVVVEAWGDRTGALRHRRVWVLSRTTGYVVFYRSWD